MQGTAGRPLTNYAVSDNYRVRVSTWAETLGEHRQIPGIDK